MRRYSWCALGVCAVAAWAAGSPVNVTLQLDQWQSPYPYRTVTQTQTNQYFTSGDEYCGFFSGLVTVGNAAPERYVFFCTEMNQNVYLNHTYMSYSMYAPDEYLQTPFRTGRPPGGGSTLEAGQVAYIRGIFRYLGIPDVSGFVSTEAQDLSGFPLTPAAQAVLNSLANDQAALAQMSIWEMTHETFDSKNPSAGIDLHAGLVQWQWQGGTPFDVETLEEFDTTVGGGLANNPEPGITGLLSSVVISSLSLRQRKRQPPLE